MNLENAFSNVGLRLEQTSTPDAEAQEHIRSEIRAYNDIHSPAHASRRKTGRQTLDLYVKDEHAVIVAGLLGTTYWDWLSIDELWVHEAYRKHGYGRTLMEHAEQVAITRGCKQACVKTWSFQARGFYETLGYCVIGKLEDYPENETLYWLRKTF